MNHLNVLYISNLAPHYRAPIWLLMANHPSIDFHFAFDPKSKTGIKSIDFNTEKWTAFETKLHYLKNLAIRGKVVFQRRVFKILASKKWDAVLLLGDANIITNWLVAFWCRRKKVPLLFWGHGLYGNESRWKRWWRLQFLQLADINLVYGHHAKQLLIGHNFSPDAVQVIYNSLDYDFSKRTRRSIIEEGFYLNSGLFEEEYPVLLFIGRLTPQKQLDRLVDAVQKLKHRNFHFNLVFIGEGPERHQLNLECEKHGIPVHFTGGLYYELEIAKYIANADLCVAPGEVGLSAIHAMSYGAPVCTHNDLTKQMPEAEAIKEGETGCFFDYHEGNLAETIENWFNNTHSREAIRSNCYAVIDNYYNPYNQLRILEDAIKKVVV